MLYDQAMVTKTDIIYMKRESFEEGRAEGIAEGGAKGRSAGIVEGEARGRSAGIVEGEARGRSAGVADTRREVAKKMLAKGMAVPDICEITDLPKSEVEKLKN